MQTDVTRVIAASPTAVFDEVGTLERYPAWMRLVHRVTALEPDDGRPAWWELRAGVGPFTRSKQLRMVRTAFVPGRLARFERVQADGRRHAEWILVATVDDASVEDAPAALVSMHLEYTGQLWSRPVLGRILDEEIAGATTALTALVAGRDGVPPARTDEATRR
jgi:hypothetical protein